MPDIPLDPGRAQAGPSHGISVLQVPEDIRAVGTANPLADVAA